MNVAELSEKVASGPVKPIEVVDNRGTVFITVSSEGMFRFARFLQETPELGFDLLEYAYGTDWPEREQIEVGYMLTSTRHQHDVVMRCFVPRAEPESPSLVNIWHAADWHEREVYDLMGVIFKGHPNLTRILTPVGIEGHPLRKDYSSPDFEPLPK